MRMIIGSIEGEYRRYKHLADSTLNQLSESELSLSLGASDNSIATIAWHVAGNLKSRFTDFLTSDGEKPWRDRDLEFLPRNVTRAELLKYWDEGWGVLLNALAELNDEHLESKVTVRREPFTVAEALHRSLAHTSYHVGQIVFLGKHLRAEGWQYLSIPPGKSADYNQSPTLERPPMPKP